MPIKCEAMQTDFGVFLHGIATAEDTLSLRRFFRERGQTPIGPPADCQILLVGLKIEQFSKLVESADIELLRLRAKGDPA